MTVFTRLATALLFLAAATPLASATFGGSYKCKNSEFFFERKSCCLPLGGDPYPPSPPPNKTCPSNGWSWHAGNKCCVPASPTPPTPTCDSDDYFWNTDTLCCDLKPTKDSDCADDEFFWPRKRVCVPKRRHTYPNSPPRGKMCPSRGWFWHHRSNCCVPEAPQPPSPPAPTCDNDDYYWNATNQCCDPKPTQDSDCDSQSFFFPEKRCCLPKGGPVSPPTAPPTGTRCPRQGWWWHPDNKCCVPTAPRPPQPSPPTCDGPNWNWSESTLCCNRSTGSKREHRARF